MTAAAIIAKLRDSGVLRAALVPSCVFAVHAVLSTVLHAYVLFPPLDIPMHFLGGVAIAYFFAACLEALPDVAIAAEYRPALHAVAIFTLTCTAALFWEFAEFFCDLLFGSHSQLSLADTLGDMALGAAGGLTYVAWAWWSGSRRSTG